MGVWFFHKHSTLSLKVSRNTRGRPGLAGRGQVGSPGQHPPSSGLESPDSTLPSLLGRCSSRPCPLAQPV